MTRRENWKTDAQYADHLTSKLVLFKLCNTFASIVFVAFLDAFNAHGCGALRHGGGCLHETYLAIWPLFLSGAAASFLGQFLAPWVQHRRVVAKTRGVYGGDDDEDPLRVVARRQFVETAEYDNIEDTIDDYLELAVQFGYVAGFGAAFPLAPLLCFFLNTVQLKQDGYKLLWFHRRPLPLEVRSIGVWEKIFGLILKASIFSNCGIQGEKRAKFPTSKAPLSAIFHSFRLIFGRAIISRSAFDAWMLFPERSRAEHSR